MTAIIFPGQGSQYLNMSMDFNENFDVARKVFQEIEDSSKINIRKKVFAKINTATDFPAKPDTTTFIDCMRWTNSTPEDTIIFEDSEVGIQCALSTGARVIRVTDVNHTIEEMKKL